MHMNERGSLDPGVTGKVRGGVSPTRVEPVVGASLRGAFRKFFLRLGHFCET
jgi:hypothetical protein